MNLKVSKILPGGNATIIVESFVKSNLRAKVANFLMDNNSLCAEQVGFLVDATTSRNADARLEMMGGEFCINGLRSVAALLYSRDSSKKSVYLESSGFSEIIECKNSEDNGQILTNITISLPIKIEDSGKGIIVSMEGISHFVQYMDFLSNEEDIEEQFRNILQLNSSLRIVPACGFMPYIEEGETLRMKPLVAVKETESMVFETGCGSGSIAVALARYAKDKTKCSSIIIQPSQECYFIEILSNKHEILTISLSSPVHIISTGTVFIPPIQL